MVPVYYKVFVGLTIGYQIFTVEEQSSVCAFLLFLVVGQIELVIIGLINRIIDFSIRYGYPTFKIAVFP